MKEREREESQQHTCRSGKESEGEYGRKVQGGREQTEGKRERRKLRGKQSEGEGRDRVRKRVREGSGRQEGKEVNETGKETWREERERGKN